MAGTTGTHGLVERPPDLAWESSAKTGSRECPWRARHPAGRRRRGPGCWPRGASRCRTRVTVLPLLCVANPRAHPPATEQRPPAGAGRGTAGDRWGALLGRGGLTPAGRRPRYKSCGASSRVLCARRRLPWGVECLHSPAAPFPSACAGPALRSCSRGRCAA